jgi:polysaccharide biosynthesis protein PelF
MRVCLLTGGGYPYRRDALGGWCRSLVEGLPGITFDLLTVTDRDPSPATAYALPPNVGLVRAVGLNRDERRRAGSNDAATAASVPLCQGLLSDQADADELFTAGLRGLAGLVPDGVSDPLAGVPLTDVLLDAWRTVRPSVRADRLPVPRLRARDARTIATLLRHSARALAVQPPRSDLVHCVGGTNPLLAALAGHWRNGTPVLLTEARAAVARWRPTEERLSPAVRTVLRRFRRAVARTGYAQAGLIAPLSAYHHGWAVEQGAPPDRLVSVPAGVDPRDYAVATEPATDEPAVVWAGSGGPDSGLDLLLDAFALVLSLVPGAVLHLVGVTEANEDHCAEKIDQAGLGRVVRLHALPTDRRDRYATGQVVVHVPGPSDPPYRLIEAMMSGRAVIGVDIGDVAETLGRAGVLVPPDAPATLAAACADLLGSPHRRRALGEAARRRALAYFTTDRVVRVYGALYADLAAPPPAESFELTLSVPAPRTGLPATMRWLTDAQIAEDHRRRP